MKLIRGGTSQNLRKSGIPRKDRGNWANYLFIAPWLVGLLLITAGPMIAALVLSFTDYSILAAPNYVGLANYERMVSDPKFLDALVVSLIYVGVSVPFIIILSLGLALALREGFAGVGLYRSLYYLPSLLGGSVAVAVMWRLVFTGDGLVNQLLEGIGIESPSSWLTNPDTSLGTLILLHIWQFGSPLVIFLAGLTQIPREYYEAASIDGAQRIRTFFSVTLPLLSPVVFFNIVMQVIGSLQAFTPAYIISNGTGGPLNSTLFFTLFVYREGFANFRMGYASALAWVLLAVIAAITALLFWSSKKWVHYT